MDIVSRDLEKAAEHASLNRFHSQSSTRTSQDAPDPEKNKELRRSPSSESCTTTSSTSSHPEPNVPDISRIDTERDLERNPTVLSRIATQKSQHSETVGASLRSRSRKEKPLPGFGAGKPYPPPLPEREAYVVEFDGPDDPLHAQNWPMNKKLYTAAILGFTTLVSAFTSSIFSTATFAVAAQFGVSSEVGILGLSLYVLGFAAGPIIWAPFSELKGRRLPLIISMFGFTLFQFATATGKDLQTVLICRFFGGLFGSSPLTIVGAVFSDMYSNRFRGIAVTVFSMTVFSGPLLSPFIGGFILENKSLGWRWTAYLTGIMGALAFCLNLFFLSETYPPVILVEKAAELRRRTKNWGIHAKQEEIEVDFHELLVKNFSRPLRLLFTEPIVLLLSIYMAFVYALLYLFLTAYPIVFQRIHGMSPGIGGLPYLGIIAGQLLAGVAVLLTQPAYVRKLKANHDIPVPEWRLPIVIAGGISFSVGLFWFGWSGYKASTHWIAPTLSGLCTGFGLFAIFLQSLNYLIDAYLLFAASALAANTFLRSIAAAGFPMFATYMFDSLHVNWASTLLGCLAAVMIPIPVLFYTHGRKLRERSPVAMVMAAPADEIDEESGEA